MAIPQIDVKTKTRGHNDSAAASYSYVVREGKYKKDVEDLRLVMNFNLPAFAENDAKKFWKAVDTHERGNARLCKTVEFALPRELNIVQQNALAKEIAETILGGRNCAATMAIHNGHPTPENPAGNPHAHMNWSERVDDGLPRSAEQFFVRYSNKKPERGGVQKTRDFKPSAWLDGTDDQGTGGIRKAFCDITNKHLAAAGFSSETFISHLTLEAQGIDRLPTKHEGAAARAIAKKGGKADRTRINDEIKQINALNAEIKHEQEIQDAAKRTHSDGLVTADPAKRAELRAAAARLNKRSGHDTRINALDAAAGGDTGAAGRPGAGAASAAGNDGFAAHVGLAHGADRSEYEQRPADAASTGSSGNSGDGGSRAEAHRTASARPKTATQADSRREETGGGKRGNSQANRGTQDQKILDDLTTTKENVSDRVESGKDEPDSSMQRTAGRASSGAARATVTPPATDEFTGYFKQRKFKTGEPKMPISQAKDASQNSFDYPEFLKKEEERKKKIYKHKLRFDENSKCYLYQNPKTKKESAQLKLEIDKDGKETLHALGSNNKMAAANMLSVARERGWEGIEVWGLSEFQQAVLDQAISEMDLGIYADLTFEDQHLNELYRQKLEEQKNACKVFDNGLAETKPTTAQIESRAERGRQLQAALDAKVAEEAKAKDAAADAEPSAHDLI